MGVYFIQGEAVAMHEAQTFDAVYAEAHATADT
jgi:hypothetical protein